MSVRGNAKIRQAAPRGAKKCAIISVRREKVRNVMSAIQSLSGFFSDSWQSLLLALGVALVTFILKKTVKKLPEKVFTFLPFALGILAFAVYRAIATLSWAPFTTEIVTTLEGGFTCGCAAILCFVACD